MENSLSTASQSQCSALELAWLCLEGGQGSPTPHLPFPSLHALAQQSQETSLAQESKEASDRS